VIGINWSAYCFLAAKLIRGSVNTVANSLANSSVMYGLSTSNVLPFNAIVWPPPLFVFRVAIMFSDTPGNFNKFCKETSVELNFDETPVDIPVTGNKDLIKYFLVGHTVL